MPQIELASEVLDDFDRFIGHLAQFEAEDAAGRVAEIVQALQVLAHSPLTGRKIKGGMRELCIGQGSRVCLALYGFVHTIDTVFVLAIRAQRESGFRVDR